MTILDKSPFLEFVKGFLQRTFMNASLFYYDKNYLAFPWSLEKKKTVTFYDPKPFLIFSKKKNNRFSMFL